MAAFAALRLGTVVSALPHEAKAQDLAHYMRVSRAALVYADGTSIDEVRRACQKIGMHNSRIISVEGSVAS